MSTIADRLREIAVDVGESGAMTAYVKLRAIATELEAAPAADAKMEADCWAIMTPNGSKLVSPQEAAGRKDAYPLYAHSAFASIAGGLIDAKATIAALQARIAELEARQVPDGWVAVPREPTREMLVATDIEADEYYFRDLDRAHEFMADGYRAMLAAAPSKPTGDARG